VLTGSKGAERAPADSAEAVFSAEAAAEVEEGLPTLPSLPPYPYGDPTGKSEGLCPNEVYCDSFVRGKTGECGEPVRGEYVEVCPIRPGSSLTSYPDGRGITPEIDEEGCRDIGKYE
jgi:hypothetical protein